jgi:hypothetical protein
VQDSPVRGEVTVLVNSATHEESFQADTLREMAGKLLERGCSVRDALLMLSRETGINRNELYTDDPRCEKNSQVNMKPSDTCYVYFLKGDHYEGQS